MAVNQCICLESLIVNIPMYNNRPVANANCFVKKGAEVRLSRRGEPKIWAQKKGKLLLSHRSTKYPCFVPNLGESMGAGRRRLTRHKSRKKNSFRKEKMPFYSRVLILMRINCSEGHLVGINNPLRWP